MIKLNDEENQRLRRVVKSANQKIRRAAKRGEKDLPNLFSVRQLKAQFTTKTDLKREVKEISRIINNKEALQRRATKEGTISNWRFDYIKRNQVATLKWINREIEKQKLILKDYPEHFYAIREKLNKLQDERDIIRINLDNLSADKLRTVGTVVDRFKRQNLRTLAGRTYFMKNLDSLLAARTVPKKERDKIMRKLENLTNDEFEEMYNRHDIISDIMTYIDSPSGGEGLSDKERFKQAEEALKEQRAKDELDLFHENFDDYVKEAKDVVKQNNKIFDASRQKWISEEEYKDIALGKKF